MNTTELLVAPVSLRSTLLSKINREIDLAKGGKKGHFRLKLNSLEDPEMIDAIRSAAENNVRVDLVIRGICCYYPITKKQQDNIRAVSIVDRFLEHTRIYHFSNDGHDEVYLASADWMTRNLSRRIEVAFPIKEQQYKNLLMEELNIQLMDSLKGRLIHEDNANVKGNETKSSQQKMFDLVKINEK